MEEIDEIARVLLAEADAWFANAFHLKLQRLIQIARAGEIHRRNLVALEFALEQEREIHAAQHPEGAPV